jgi:ubiquinone/menaquinone biosynthesis C-methylase UbiE
MDVVVSTLVLCSVRNVKQTLKEVHRVLAPVSVTQFTCVSFPFPVLII